MELFTTQLSNWRTAKRLKIELVDTTVKGKAPLFAPTWDMVMGHKNGTITDEEYTRLYREKMIQSWVENREGWERFMQREEPIALACYCAPGKFCHRKLLVKILEKLCARLNIPFKYYGELI